MYNILGVEYMPKAGSGKLLLVFWWLFTIIMYSTYTANLTATLTAPITTKPAGTLQEVADNPSLQPIAMASSATETLFKV